MSIFIPIFISLITLCTPYDNAEGALVQLLQSTKKQCLVAVYTINSPILVNTLIQLKTCGYDVEVITDSTQAKGAHEVLALNRLRRHSIPVFIGKSVDHQIMHTKMVIVDDEYVGYGSFNWTDVAQKQDNTLTIEDNPQLAKQLHAYWEQIKKDLK